MWYVNNLSSCFSHAYLEDHFVSYFIHSCSYSLCRDYLSPNDIIGNYPHLVVVGTGLAFGFLVVRYMLIPSFKT